jgi:hypothetical protein
MDKEANLIDMFLIVLYTTIVTLTKRAISFRPFKSAMKFKKKSYVIY